MCIYGVNIPLLQLNNDGEIELTEIQQGTHGSSQVMEYQFPSLDEEQNVAMMDNHRVIRANHNNNYRDYVVPPDTTPRLRRPSGFVVRGTNPRNRKVWVNIRQRAKDIKSKMPQVKDVNNIDKYSRLMFPLLFLIFNAWYWVYYSVLSSLAITEKAA